MVDRVPSEVGIDAPSSFVDESSESSNEASDLNVDYEIIEELGRGGSAIVYRARDRGLGREVAIKVVRPRHATTDDESLQRLAREARTVAGLQHPNIVTVHAVKRLDDGGLALVMQLVPGRTLKQAVAMDGPFPAERAERVLRDVASALAYAHAHGVIHRDVKPENIFIDADTGRALLSDFGIAHSAEFDSRLTMTGTAIGTPAYMSPEQIDGKPTDSRSDVYSLGLVAWEMLTGRRPWDGESLYNVIFKQKREDLPAIDSLVDGVPLRLQYIVERMIQKRPGARWAGADGLLAHMNAWVIPSDWTQWQQAHNRQRRAREKAASARASQKGEGGSAGLLQAALATVRFRRPPDGERSAPGAGTLAADDDVVTSTASISNDYDDEYDDDSSSPSWVTASPGKGRWKRVAASVAAFAVVSVGGYALYANTIGNADTFPTTSTLPASADTALVGVLPMAGTLGDSVLDSPSDTAGPLQANGGVVDSSLAAATLARARADSAMLRAYSNVAGKQLGTIVALDSSSAPSSTSSVSGMPTVSPSAGPPALASVIAAPLTSAVTSPVVPRGRNSASSGDGGRSSVKSTNDPGIVAAGGRHSCVLESGKLFCWGANDRGQLGDGGLEARSIPDDVLGDADFVQVAAGVSHSCAVTRSGDAYCWGNDERGQLGDATTTSRNIPALVAGNLKFREVRAGLAYSCGLTTGGSVACWGANESGQLGNGSTGMHTSPDVIENRRFVAVATGWKHACAIGTDGLAYCWGDNSYGQLGDGTNKRNMNPSPAIGNVRFTSIAAGSSHTCAVAESGEVYCWGRNSSGQLGTNGTVSAAASTAASIAASGGAGNTTSATADRSVPTAVESSTRFMSVTAGSVHTCARTRAGAAYCWGQNSYGQLGDGTTVDRKTPVRVLGPYSFAAISATSAHTCGITNDKVTYCWGYNTDGQLGEGSRNHRSRPTAISVSAR